MSLPIICSSEFRYSWFPLRIAFCEARTLSSVRRPRSVSAASANARAAPG